MKNLKTMKLLSFFLLSSVFIFNSCQTSPKPRYCTFAMASNRCENIKDITNLCFECTGKNGGTCPELENKSVWLGTKKNSEGKYIDSCCVKLGKKLSDCGKCEDSVVGRREIDLKRFAPRAPEQE